MALAARWSGSGSYSSRPVARAHFSTSVQDHTSDDPILPTGLGKSGWRLRMSWTYEVRSEPRRWAISDADTRSSMSTFLATSAIYGGWDQE